MVSMSRNALDLTGQLWYLLLGIMQIITKTFCGSDQVEQYMIIPGAWVPVKHDPDFDELPHTESTHPDTIETEPRVPFPSWQHTTGSKNLFTHMYL